MIKLRVVDEAGLPKEVEVSLTELQQMLDTGDPDPALEVWSDTLTQGQWKPLGDLMLYKRAMAARDGGGSLAMRDITDRAKSPHESGDSKGGGMWTCAKCGKEQQDTVQFCWYCSAARGTAPGVGSAVSTADHVVTHYGTLRIIAKAFRVLAWLTAASCLLGAIAAIAAAGKMANSGYGSSAGGLGALGVLVYLVAGAVGFVSFYAGAESILVFLDIEENTRATRSLTQRSLEVLVQLVTRQPSGKS